MDRRILLFLVVFITLSTLNSQELPRVAVLDGLIPGEMSHNASPVVANYISETLGGSGKYVVVDRKLLYTSWGGAPQSEINVANLSGRGDYAALGEFFKAQLICQPRVTIEGGAYVVTAEIIEAATGNILARESATAQGRIVALIDASRLAGTKLSGGSLSDVPLVPVVAATTVAPQSERPDPPQGEPDPERITTKKKEPQAQGDPVREERPETPPKEKKGFGSATISMTLPSFLGNEDNPTFNVWDDDIGSYVDIDKPIYDLFTDTADIAFDANMKFTGSSFFYFELGAAAAMQLLSYTDSYEGSESYKLNFSLVDLYLGTGIVLPMGSRFQVSAGGTVGYGMIILGGETWSDSSDVPVGITFGANAGADLKLSEDFVLMVKYRYTYAPQLVGGSIFTQEDYDSGYDTSLGYSGFFVGIGAPF